ncbi:hypothetical protein ID866_7555 [Astraeus odoratus]|nr:hypothetical protein ID866_7555 [Astraeus odoratus]
MATNDDHLRHEARASNNMLADGNEQVDFTPLRWLRRITTFLAHYKIETHGIAPIARDERLETRWYQMFFVWFSANMNILTFSTGTAGPAFFSLGVTFFGYRFLHWYESVAWIPNVVAFIVMLALGYPHLHANQSTPVPAPTVASVLSFASTLAASMLSWCTMTPDYGVYHSPAPSSTRIFFYTYLGFFTASITAHTLGAAFAAAAPTVSAWDVGFQDSTSVGGLVYSVLAPVGGFGKLLTVLVALSIPSACAPSMYTFSTSSMAIAGWFALVPRWVYILVSEAILIPVAIVGAKTFYTTFVDILSVIGYWSAAFAAIVLIEHILFRRASFSEEAYPIATWNSAKLLPSGVPAVLAFFCAFGTLIPFMSQAWYVGPVAEDGSGDCGIYVGFVVAAITYAVFRAVEVRITRPKEGAKEREPEDGLKH